MTYRIFIISLVLLGLVQLSFGQKTVSPAKRKLVSQLVETTAEIFPYQEFDNMVEKTRIIFSSGLEEEFGKEIERKIEADGNLSDEKKAEIKAKIPAFSKQVSNHVDQLLGKNFNIKAWVRESAAKNFTRNFTVAELQKLNTFFQSKKGQNTLLVMNRALAYGIRNETGETNLVDAEKFARDAELLLATETGQKFLKMLNKNVMNDIGEQLDKFGDSFISDLQNSANRAKLEQMVERFIEENIVSE